MGYVVGVKNDEKIIFGNGQAVINITCFGTTRSPPCDAVNVEFSS